MSNTRKTTAARTKRAAPPPAEPPKVDIHQLLASGETKRAEDVVPLCLRGDLNRQWQEAKAEFDRLGLEGATGRLGDGAERRRVAQQMADIEAQMRSATVDFTLRALRRRRTPATPADETTWIELFDNHPPRKGEDGKLHPHDTPGVNMATFPDALIRASVVDPVLSEQEWAQLLDDGVLNDAQADRLFEAAWRLNRNEISIPFSRAASIALTSAPGSRRHANSA